jgi:DNA adenine methylase
VRTAASNPVIPIVRWAGSKRRLLGAISARLPKAFDRYIEPFAGSACVFLALNPKSARINDINSELIGAYRAIKRDVLAVCDALSDFPHSRDLYYLLREIEPSSLDRASRAARFLYLNRYSFNGVYRTNSAGQFNVPMGKKTGGMPSKRNFLAFADRLQSASLSTSDFEHVVSSAQGGDLIYLDPPYSQPGVKFRGEYGYGAFAKMDEPRLVSCLADASRRGVMVLLSYTASIAPEFPGWRIDRVRVSRSVAGFSAARRRVEEVLISNY